MGTNVSLSIFSDSRTKLHVGGEAAHIAGGVPVADHPARGRAGGDRAVPGRRADGTGVGVTQLVMT